MVNSRDYDPGTVEASRTVMHELMHILSPYREHIVLVGGSVPWVMYPNADVPHVGTMDVDLAIERGFLSSPDMTKIEEILKANGYQQSLDIPYIFHRTIHVNDRDNRIQVDLLTGEGSTSKADIVQPVHGCDLAFLHPDEIESKATLPDGHMSVTILRYASIVPFLAMKAITFSERRETKDAYDIFFCVLNYPGGNRSLAQEFKKNLHDPSVAEGIEKLKESFSAFDSIGPKAIRDFSREYDDDRRDQIQRDAFERINDLMSRI